jgi:anti-sigma factor RsiW
MAWLRTGIVCRKAVDLVTEYLEDALPPRDRARFEAHVAGCPHCAEYLRQMRSTVSAVGRAAPVPLPPDARSELAAVYRRWRSG